jgi:hypothetical protein
MTTPDPNPVRLPPVARPSEPARSAPDFARGVFVADKPGAEFASLRNARIAAPGAAGWLFLPVIGLCYLLHLTLVSAFGVPTAVSVGVSGVLGAVGLVLVFAHTLRGGFGKPDHALFHAAANTDTRYRLRVVIPRSRQTGRLGRWAMKLAGVEQDRLPSGDEELGPQRGGFEPIIVRPWRCRPHPAILGDRLDHRRRGDLLHRGDRAGAGVAAPHARLVPHLGLHRHRDGLGAGPR